MTDRLDDKGKDKDKLLDRTKPVPVPAGEGKVGSTDEGQEPTYLYDRAPQAPEAPREGSALHPKVEATGGSFDDEVEASGAPGRPARIAHAQRAKPAARQRQPEPEPMPAGASDVFTSHSPQKPTAAARSADGRRADDVETRAMLVPAAAVSVSGDERAEPDEPTRARDPDPPPAVPTATHVRPPRDPRTDRGAAMDDVTLRLPEEAGSPDAPTSPARTPAPSGPTHTEVVQRPILADDDVPVDVTPALPRTAIVGLPDRLPPDEQARLANDDTRVKAPPRTADVDISAKRGLSPLWLVLGGLVVTGFLAGLAFVLVTRPDGGPPPPAPTPPKVVDVAPTPTPPPAPTPPKIVDVAPTPAVPTPAVPTPTPTPTPPQVVDVVPPPATNLPPPDTEDPPPTAPTRVPARPRDGFGPFGDKSGSGVVGVGPALGRGVRAALGANAFATSLLGVRGEVKRLDIVRADGQLSVTAECTLVVTERNVARATMGATVRVAEPDKVGRDRVARLAAETCATALDATLKAAVAHTAR